LRRERYRNHRINEPFDIPGGVHGAIRRRGLRPARLSEEVEVRHLITKAGHGFDRRAIEAGRRAVSKKPNDLMLEEPSMAKRRKQAATLEVGSRNVYADLGFDDADEMLVKAQLVSRISEIIKDRGYSQTDAAQRLGLPQPKLSKLLRGQFRGISERKLMDCLTRLGNDIEIVVRERAGGRKVGHVSVVFA
jgi:predicted XRE-type DNA-binding protein